MMPCFNIETYSAGVLRAKDMKTMTMKKRKYKVKVNSGENSCCVSNGYVPEAACAIEPTG